MKHLQGLLIFPLHHVYCQQWPLNVKVAIFDTVLRVLYTSLHSENHPIPSNPSTKLSSYLEIEKNSPFSNGHLLVCGGGEGLCGTYVPSKPWFDKFVQIGPYGVTNVCDGVIFWRQPLICVLYIYSIPSIPQTWHYCICSAFLSLWKHQNCTSSSSPTIIIC